MDGSDRMQVQLTLSRLQESHFNSNGTKFLKFSDRQVFKIKLKEKNDNA